MRFLSKIVFINSATIPYSEIKLDGNIHFIGTQGVGKSTILRAILYFYNADARKLGVPTGPTNKRFADWYFSWGNSYIVYEVVRETGPYCVFAFKSQNKVCYRFLDTAYDRKYFLDDEGNALESWEKIRALLDADRKHYSRKIISNEQYRDILYGNNVGKNEFKKYALLEAKQYKNIYRTIQNVFLNSKLDADFIKQTIISSMAEEELNIDLQQYAHHLKDFETQLNDIKRFKYPSVLRNAENSAKMYAAIKHISHEKVQLAKHLAVRLNEIKETYPLLLEEKESVQKLIDAINKELAYEKQLFGKRKDRTIKEMSLLDGKLKESARQKAYYQSLNVDEIIRRVALKNDLDNQRDSLLREQNLLKSNFADITQKYDALISGQKNDLNNFINQKNTEILSLQKGELQERSKLEDAYKQLLDDIENQHQEIVANAQNEVDLKKANVIRLEKQKIVFKHKRFFESEIEQEKAAVAKYRTDSNNAENNIEHYRQQIKTIQSKWELEKKGAEATAQREKEKLGDEMSSVKKKIEAINSKLENSKDSLYSWLNSERPGWDQNIGQVIDEDILFHSGLSPRNLLAEPDSFYGIHLDLNEIDKPVKTVEDYQFELTKLNQELKSFQQKEEKITEKLEAELVKIQKRNLPKIREYKDKIREGEYSHQQLSEKIKQAELTHISLQEKAKSEKKQQVDQIQSQIEEASAEEVKSIEKLKELKGEIDRKKASKDREKKKKFNDLAAEVQNGIGLLEKQIENQKEESQKYIQSIHRKKTEELDAKGADTKRLNEIDRQLIHVDSELDYIEKNRDTVSEYRKDKRELFDNEKAFKSSLQLEEAKLDELQTKFKNKEQELSHKYDEADISLLKLKDRIKSIDSDLDKYENEFIKTEVYLSIETLLRQKQSPDESLEGSSYKNAISIMDAITAKYYERMNRENDLKESVDKFLGHFSANNIFKFPEKLSTTEQYLNFSEDLTDFVEENKIEEFEKRVNERFATIISSVGKETSMLISKAGEIQKIITKINRDFTQKNFVGAVKKIALNVADSKNSVVVLLKMIKEFNDENAMNLGQANLFTTVGNKDKSNEKAIELLKQLVKEINMAKDSNIRLADSFELTFRVEENQNDTGWVEKLSNVGSDGTDVLVKAMVNIMLLNVFKEGASKRFKNFRLHCMMDEIGKLHPNNIKGILKFANDRNILLINGSPTENTPLSYRHIYKINKDVDHNTVVKRIISQN